MSALKLLVTSFLCRCAETRGWSRNQVTLTPSLPFVPCLQAAAIFKVLLFVPLGLNIQWSLAQRLSLPVTGHLFQTADIEQDRKESAAWKKMKKLKMILTFLTWHSSPLSLRSLIFGLSLPLGFSAWVQELKIDFFFSSITSHPVILSLAGHFRACAWNQIAAEISWQADEKPLSCLSHLFLSHWAG